ncbi:hypothetical protein [Phormidesmis priestleyi]
MKPENDYTPIPLTVLAALRDLTGEEFKVMGILCYQTYNRQTPQLTIEQIQSFAGIPRDKIKPVLNRLMRRSWVVSDGVFYELALKNAATSANKPDSTVQYDPRLGIRPPRPKAHLLYPEGPWLTENGLLNEDFVLDRAQVWRTGDHFQAKSFGEMAIEDVMGIVCKYYAKPANHASLEIDWQSYCLKNRRYLSNIQRRIESGAEIGEAEQAVALNKLPAVIQEAQPIYEAALLPTLPNYSKVHTLLKSSMNSDENPPNNPEQVQAEIQRMIADKSMSDAQPLRDQMKTVEKLRLWLSDPILRPEGERLARAKGYELKYNEAGTAIDIVIDEDGSTECD